MHLTSNYILRTSESIVLQPMLHPVPSCKYSDSDSDCLSLVGWFDFLVKISVCLYDSFFVASSSYSDFSIFPRSDLLVLWQQRLETALWEVTIDVHEDSSVDSWINGRIFVDNDSYNQQNSFQSLVPQYQQQFYPPNTLAAQGPVGRV